MSFNHRVNRLQDQLGQKGGMSNGQIRDRIKQLRTQHQTNQQGQHYFQQQANRPPDPLPYSGAYDSTVASATNTFNQTQSDLAGRQLATEQQYGITDQSNPYAQARLLERNYGQQRNATFNSAAASGQLYAGQLSDAQNNDRFNYGVNQDQMLRQYQATLGDLSSQSIAAQNTYNDTLAQAKAQQIQDAISNPVDPATAPKPPRAAQQYLQTLRQRAQHLAKQGKDNKANALRDRIQKLNG